MNKFTDANKREWFIAIDYPTSERVKAELGVDLLDVQGSWSQLGELPVLAEVAWALCKSQAAEREVSRDNFWAALDGDAFEDLLAAVVGAVIDFFPRQKREAMRKTWEKLQERMNKQADPAKLEAAIDAAIDEALTELSGK